MPKNRFKIDLNDDDGNKFTISLEGHLTRTKVLQILDFVDLLGGSSMEKIHKTSSDSKFGKLQKVIQRQFPVGWFTSQEVMIAYEDTLDEPIGLSTVSTYLTRLAIKGVLNKSGSKAKRIYKVTSLIYKSDTQSRYHVSP